MPDDDNYSIITIAGKSKTGKSFLLNNLLNSNSMFPINHCIGGKGSEGISIATRVMQIGKGNDSAQDIKCIVLDCEGFGAL